MVGIVIASHSRKAAEGIAEMCSQLARGEVPIEAAGGMEDGSLGTDALRIREAIMKVLGSDGAVVLADLGSAVMSAEMAIELLEEPPGRAAIADAPVLEGAVAAAVQASAGADLEEVLAAAEEARQLRKRQA